MKKYDFLREYDKATRRKNKIVVVMIKGDEVEDLTISKESFKDFREEVEQCCDEDMKIIEESEGEVLEAEGFKIVTIK